LRETAIRETAAIREIARVIRDGIPLQFFEIVLIISFQYLLVEMFVKLRSSLNGAHTLVSCNTQTAIHNLDSNTQSTETAIQREHRDNLD